MAVAAVFYSVVVLNEGNMLTWRSGGVYRSWGESPPSPIPCLSAMWATPLSSRRPHDIDMSSSGAGMEFEIQKVLIMAGCGSKLIAALVVTTGGMCDRGEASHHDSASLDSATWTHIQQGKNRRPSTSADIRVCLLPVGALFRWLCPRTATFSSLVVVSEKGSPGGVFY